MCLYNTFHWPHSHRQRHFRNFPSLFSACPNSGKLGSSLPQFSMSLRVVPSGRGWWGPAVHNVCFSLRLPLYSATPAWLWRVAKLWGVVHASGGACMLEPLQTSYFLPRRQSTGYKSLSWIGQLQWDAWEDVVMNNQTNCNKQCEVVCKWLRI